MASYSIADIRAIGPFYAGKLKAAGIRSSTKLLDRARTPKGRKQLAELSGIPSENILKWANLADLMRVPGVAADYAELLAAAGVDTVKELKRRNVGNLVARMVAVNERKRMVEALPSEKRVARWIEEAKLLEPMMTY
jgi:predicted flap endonuclease-1-like 5' DNA nuclease